MIEAAQLAIQITILNWPQHYRGYIGNPAEEPQFALFHNTRNEARLFTVTRRMDTGPGRYDWVLVRPNARTNAEAILRVLIPSLRLRWDGYAFVGDADFVLLRLACEPWDWRS